MKRKLSNAYKKSAKRRKIASKPKPKPILYINDIDVCNQSELVKLHGIGPKKAQQIIDERNKKAFKSEQDFINRVSQYTLHRMKVSVDLRFKTQFEQEFDKTYGTLINSDIELLNNQPTDTIRLIAEMCVGQRISCDNPNCDETIFFMKDKQQKKKPKYCRGLLNKEFYIYHEPNYGKSNKNIYYHRISKDIGNVMYCNKCTRKLRHCNDWGCDGNVYFEDDESSYNICPHSHYLTDNMHRFGRTPLESDTLFGYVMCNHHEFCWRHRWRSDSDDNCFHARQDYEMF